MFVYPTQARSGSTPLKTANAQTDANHMMGHAEPQRAPPEAACVCLYVCHLTSVWQDEVCNTTNAITHLRHVSLSRGMGAERQ